ncbi:MAG: PilZ domain-containing protein, partial [Terriglobales bacterium]
MVDTTLEQRRLRRHLVRMPVSVRWAKGDVGGTVLALVRDISERGVFLYLDAKVPEGASIEFTLALPHEIVGDTSSIFNCKGRVVRLEEPLGGKSGVGARIDQYHKVPKTSGTANIRTQPSNKDVRSEPTGASTRKMPSMSDVMGNKT